MRGRRMLCVCLALTVVLALFPAQALAAEAAGSAEETPEILEEAVVPGEKQEDPALKEEPEGEPVPEEPANDEEPEETPAPYGEPEEAPVPEASVSEESVEAEGTAVPDLGQSIIKDGKLVHHYTWGFLTLDTTTGTLEKAEITQIDDMVINEAIDGYPIKAIGEGLFQNSKRLRSISLPASIRRIEKEAFRGCVYLKTVNLNTGLEYIGESAFFGCDMLESIEIPATVKTIGRDAFYESSNLRSVTLQEGLERIEDGAFHFADLREIKVPESVTYMGSNLFAQCINLKTVKLPASVKEFGSGMFGNCTGLSGTVRIPNGVTSIGSQTFIDCVNLETVIYPDTITSIGNDAFHGCSSLKGFQLPKNLTSIGEWAFVSCVYLTSVTIPAGVTSLPSNAFSACGVQTAFIHAGVTSMNNYAFTKCPLKDVYYGGTEEQWKGLISGFGMKDTIHDAVIHYNWSDSEILYPLDGLTLRFRPSTQTILDCTGTARNYSLSIPGEINGYPVKAIADGVFQGRTDIISLSVSASVISIGAAAFQNCSELTSVYFDSAEEPITIGSRAFEGCGKLAWVSWDTTNYRRVVSSVGEAAFHGCTSLVGYRWLDELSFSPGLQTIGDKAFEGCTAMKTVCLPESVASIGANAFPGTHKDGGPVVAIYEGSRAQWEQVALGDAYFAPRLVCNYGRFGANRTEKAGNGTIYLSGDTIIGSRGDCTGALDDLPRINGSSGVHIDVIGEYAFSGCEITSVDLRNINMIGDCAFYGCGGLSSAANLNAVSSIGDGAFAYCRNLGQVTLSEKLTRIGAETFLGAGLTGIVIPDAVESIGDRAFQDANSLKSVTLPKNLKELGAGVFQGCDWLEAVYFQGTQAEWDALTKDLTDVLPDRAVLYCMGPASFQAEGGLVYFDPASRTITGADKTVTKVEIPGLISGQPVEIIGKEAFAECGELVEIVFPASLKEIGKQAFYRCSKLNRGGVIDSMGFLALPANTTVIGEHAFQYCEGLKTVILPDAVKTIPSSLFSGCRNLASVNLPGEVTGIGAYAFEGCTSLEEIRIPDKVTDLGGSAFEGCTGLKTVTFGENPALVNLGYDAFKSCTGLEHIELPESVRNLYGSTFSGCTGLVSVRLPSEVDSFGSYVFEKCEKLENVQLPRGITSVGRYAFADCRKLASITVPEGVTVIEMSAFDRCGLVSILLPSTLSSIEHAGLGASLLEDVYFSGTRAQWEGISISSNNWNVNPATPANMARIHCADDSAAGAPAQGACGERLSWALEDGRILSIRGAGAMEDYAPAGTAARTSSQEAPWAYARDTIRTVLVEPGVTYLGSNAFSGCKELSQVSLPESLESAGENAFRDCGKLSDVRYGGSSGSWASMDPSVAGALEEAEVQTGSQTAATRMDNGTIRISGAGDSQWASINWNWNSQKKQILAAVLDSEGRFAGMTKGTFEKGVVTLEDGTVFPTGQEGAELRLFLLSDSGFKPLTPRLRVS